MQVKSTSIPEVKYIVPKVFTDARGFLMETWRNSWLNDLGIEQPFVQDNHSSSNQGTLRGLHYQIKQPQGKLVRVISGEVFDVAVDIRKYSPTFGQWVGEILSSENKKIIWIPPGFAHGFLVTSPTAELVYKCTTYYAPEYERSIQWNDPTININWPIPKGCEILISEKDQNATAMEHAEVFGERQL